MEPIWLLGHVFIQLESWWLDLGFIAFLGWCETQTNSRMDEKEYSLKVVRYFDYFKCELGTKLLLNLADHAHYSKEFT